MQISQLRIYRLQAAFENDTPDSKSLLNPVTRFSSSLRGTCPFWVSKRQQLVAYLKNIGPPHLFVTLSAADLHWDDLMQHMPRYTNWQQGTNDERLKIPDLRPPMVVQPGTGKTFYLCRPAATPMSPSVQLDDEGSARLNKTSHKLFRRIIGRTSAAARNRGIWSCHVDGYPRGLMATYSRK